MKFIFHCQTMQLKDEFLNNNNNKDYTKLSYLI